jgi:exportin-T
MMNAALPLLLRFMSDAHADVTFAASPFVGDLLRAVSCRSILVTQLTPLQYKKYHTPKVSAPPPRSKMPPPPPPVIPLSEERRQFLSSLLDILIRQLAWPRDAEWEAPTGEEPDLGDELATMQAKRIVRDVVAFALIR